MNPRDQLLIAITSDHPQAVARLVNRTDLTVQDENKRTPIELARHLEHWECVRAIAKNKKTDDDDEAGYSKVLMYAVYENKNDCARILLTAGASPDWRWEEKGETNLHTAVRNRNTPMLELLISFNADLTLDNDDKQTPIQLAVNLEYWDCVEAIAARKRTNNEDKARYNSALIHAVSSNQLKTARALLEAGASPSDQEFTETGDTCLHTAVRKNNPPMITLLLAFGADATLKNKAQLTPIELGTSLNTHCFSLGWRKYFDHEIFKTQTVLILFAQAARQKHPLLSRIPYCVLEFIFPFFSREIDKTTVKIERTKTQLNTHRQEAIISAAKKFIKGYGFFSRPSSAVSKNFIASLKSNPSNSQALHTAVTLFVKDRENNKSKKNKTFTKLQASELYKLTK